MSTKKATKKATKPEAEAPVDEVQPTTDLTPIPAPVTQEEVDESKQPKAPTGPIDNGEEAS